MNIIDSIARAVRKEVLASGRGRLVEESIYVDRTPHGTLNGESVYGARFQIYACEGRTSWHDAFFTPLGNCVGEWRMVAGLGGDSA